MAVYTQLDEVQLRSFLSDYDLGELSAFQGIDGGIENTNYFVDTLHKGVQRRFVLTLFEELPFDELNFFVELTAHLAAQGVDVPAPFKDRHGIALKTLASKPVLLLPRFTGRPLERADAGACAQIGAAIARFHLAGQAFFMTRQAHRGVFWWRRESNRVAPLLRAEDAELLRGEVALFDELRDNADGLPVGVIHGDLFVDNALFEGHRLSGIIDIYNACTGFLLYDLAIIANDWCVKDDGALDTHRLDPLLSAYAAVRPFTDAERRAWPLLLRTAAMRFWLSRLISLHGLEARNYEGEQVIKDPEPLRQILLQHIAHPSELPTAHGS